MIEEHVRGRSVLVFGSDKARSRVLPESLEVAALASYSSDAAPSPSSFDVALIVEWEDAAALTALARAAHDAVRPGGWIAFVGPARDGLFSGMLRRKPKVSLEDLCEALLLAGARDLGARPQSGADPRIVFGVARA